MLKLERRISKIRGNPDPTKMKSNVRMYELEHKYRQRQFEAWRAGKPFADGTFLSILFKAMGFEYADLMRTADRTQMAGEYFDVLRREGLPDDACDRTIVCIAMCKEGHFPVPDFLVTTNMACDPAMLMLNTVAHMFDKVTFPLDIPLEANEESLKYVTAQLYELVEVAEKKFPGIKLDTDKLQELQELDRQAFVLYREMAEFRKAVPSPLSGQDAFRLPRLPHEMADPYEYLDYIRQFRDEIGEKAAKGLGASKEEKLRVIWTVSGPYYLNPFDLLQKRGVSVVWFHFGMGPRIYGLNYGVYGDEEEYGRKLSPMEEVARMVVRNTWAGRGSRWIGNLLLACREFKVDAIINFVQVGCVASAGLATLVANAAENELGIPTLQVEGRQLDATSIDRNEFLNRLNDFVDICLTRKGIPIT